MVLADHRESDQVLQFPLIVELSCGAFCGHDIDHVLFSDVAKGDHLGVMCRARLGGRMMFSAWTNFSSDDIVVTGKNGCAVERFVILILELSREQQSDVVLFADVDDLVNQRADLFVVNVFFGHGFASAVVHRQAVCGLVGYAGKQAT